MPEPSIPIELNTFQDGSVYKMNFIYYSLKYCIARQDLKITITGSTPWLTLGKILTLTIYPLGRKFPKKTGKGLGAEGTLFFKYVGEQPSFHDMPVWGGDLLGWTITDQNRPTGTTGRKRRGNSPSMMDGGALPLTLIAWTRDV